ncbi:unnamed protein product, partial [Linum tenue]
PFLFHPSTPNRKNSLRRSIFASAVCVCRSSLAVARVRPVRLAVAIRFLLLQRPRL